MGTVDEKETGPAGMCCEVVYAGRYGWIRVYFGSLGEGIPLWSPFWKKRGTANGKEMEWQACVLTTWYLFWNRF